MANTAIMTVRMEPRLLALLKQRARREGRSVSAEVVRLIRREVGAAKDRIDAGIPRRAPVKTMGMFAAYEAPDLEEFRRVRRRASNRIRAGVRASGDR